MNLPGDLFTAVVNMSITASCVAVGVILVRLLLKKSAEDLFLYSLGSRAFPPCMPVFFRLGFQYFQPGKPGCEAGKRSI